MSEPLPEIPGYRFLGVVGQGGMSTVYMAEQQSLGRKVAVKVMLPEALGDEVSRRQHHLCLLYTSPSPRD